MKNSLKVLSIFLLISLTSISLCKAYFVYGWANIVWKGSPWTATSGTFHCTADPLVYCCSINGDQIAINMGGTWWWGTIEHYGIDENGQENWWEFPEEGLIEGPGPK